MLWICQKVQPYVFNTGLSIDLCLRECTLSMYIVNVSLYLNSTAFLSITTIGVFLFKLLCPVDLWLVYDSTEFLRK